MATVMNISEHVVPLTVGLLAPNATRNVDTSLALEQSLLADGVLGIVDADVSPALPDELADKSPGAPLVWSDDPGEDEFVVRRADGRFETSGIAAGRIRRPTNLTNQVNELIDWAVNHGRKFVQLDERGYDSSAFPPAAPAGFRIEGASHDTTVIDLPLTGDAVRLGAYASLSHCFLNIKGAIAGPARGVSPAPSSNGIIMGSKARLISNYLQRFHTVIRPQGDHQYVEDNETFECAVAIFQSSYDGPRGNFKALNNRFTGLTFASLFVAIDTEMDSFESYSNHWGSSPYGWFGHSADGQHEFALTNVTSFNDSWEDNGNRHVDLGRRKISGDFYNPKTGALKSDNRLANGSGTFSGIYSTGNGAYVFESGNGDAASLGASGPVRTTSDGKFSVHGSGGDTANGPFLTPGSTGVFHTN